MSRWNPAILCPAYIERMSIPEPNTGCWLWLGSMNDGYGQVRIKGLPRSNAHRASFMAHHATIDISGLDVDHVCNNPACVNPGHLEAVTHRENCRRRDARRSDVCARGHKYDYMDTRGARRCRQCDAVSAAAYRARAALAKVEAA